MTAESTSVNQAAPKRSGAKGLLLRVASVAISAALMIYILAQIDFTSFFAMIRSTPTWSLLGAFLIYFILSVIRAFRFRMLLGGGFRPPIADLMPVIWYHNFLNRVLPFNTGEISYVVLVNRRFSQPLSEGISSLLTARLFDLAMVLIGIAFGLFSIAGYTREQRILMFIGVLIALVLYVIGVYYAGSLLRFTARVWSRTIAPLVERRFPRFEHQIEDKLHVLSERFDRIHDPRLLMRVALLSVFTNAGSVGFDMVLMWGLGVPYSFGLLLAIISIKMFIEAVPIPLNGFGVVEASWVFGLTTLGGMDVPTAASIGVFLHAYQVILATLMGGVGYIMLARTRHKLPARANVN